MLQGIALTKHFPIAGGWSLSQERHWLKAVDGVDIQVQAGEALGIVGESGSGKTTLAKMLLLLERPTSGDLLFHRHGAACVWARRFRALSSCSAGRISGSL